ncbi:MAG: hypothetical protein SFU27_13850 [Thermonemataceae bacterium]|nr:hypothetical protein [Thermonemataceae bacterium]
MTYEILYKSDSEIIFKDNFMVRHFEKNGDSIFSDLGVFLGVHDNFISNKDAYINDLIDYSGFDANKLNYTPKSLYMLDETYKKANSFKKRVKFPNLFIEDYLFLDIPENVVWGMIAYTGEVVIKETKGNWVLKKEEYHFSVGNIKIYSYIPYVYGKKGDKYPILQLVLLLFEDCGEFEFYLAPRIIAALKFGVSNTDMFI